MHYVYALAPLGFGMWLAHYSFHFLTGGLTIVPVIQSFLADVGLFGGKVEWGLGAAGAARTSLPHPGSAALYGRVRLDRRRLPGPGVGPGRLLTNRRRAG